MISVTAMLPNVLDLLGNFGSQVFWWTIPFLFVLTVIVFFHELGHFLVARWCGVKVDVFAIGFGREIFGFNDSKGTRWKFCWIPLGGYVKFMDDENAASAPDADAMRTMSEEDKAGSFHFKPLWQRAAVVAAGPIANFLLAIVMLSGLFMTIGKAIITPTIQDVLPGGAAAAADFRSGDVFVSVDGNAIETFTEVQRIVSLAGGRELEIILRRDGKNITKTLTPEVTETKDGFGNKVKLGRIGVRGGSATQKPILKTFGPIEAVGEGVKETWFLTTQTLTMLKELVMGRADTSQLGGPIRIAQASKQAASLSIVSLIALAAIISIGIGLLNLFPIPVLDGGHLLFYAIEAVRGKPLSENVQEFGFKIGLALVLMLMVFVTWNDLSSVVFG